MKRLIPLLLLLLFLATSCNDNPVLQPGLNLAMGKTWDVELDVDFTTELDMVGVSTAADERQQFTAGYTWKVVDIADDTVYTIESTVTSFKVNMKNASSFDDQIVMLTDPDTMQQAQVKRVELSEIAQGMVGRIFRFTITKSGEVQSVLGADSAIYESFRVAYGGGADSLLTAGYMDAGDTLFRQDFYLMKSFCGNSAFARYVDQLFGPLRTPDGWQAGESFENTTQLSEQLESMDTELPFVSKNEWTCAGPDSKGGYGLSVTGEFGNRRKGRNFVDMGMTVRGKQDGTFSYDTATFLPRSVSLKQQYVINTGMGAGFFSFRISSFRVKKNINFTLK